jgi:nucleoside-diphosphate-sugar epimerase
MRVFVTGATGFIGQAVVQELLDAGHTVVGLARSESKAAELRAKGADTIPGSIEDIESLKRGASESDGVIHLAFNHDFTKFAENAKVEYNAIVAIGSVLTGSNRPFVIASGTMMLTKGTLGTEDSDVDLVTFPNPRAGNEGEITKLAAQGVRTSSVRLSPTVHGDQDHGFINLITQVARTKGESVYIGDGQNKWPAVHRYDAARLFRLALEKGEPGAKYHAVGEEGIPMKEIAEAIGHELGVPTVSKTLEEAQVHFNDFMAFAVGADNPSSSTKTQEQLGWMPSERGLLADIKAGVYTKQGSKSGPIV